MEGRNSPFSSTCFLDTFQSETVNRSDLDTNMEMASLVARAKQLASLHVPYKPLVVTNVWDAGTAKVAALHPSCAAIATASYAIAASAGVEDDDLTPEQNLAAIEGIAAVASKHGGGKPLTADMQSGYGERLEEVVRALVRSGVVGCNLEDRDTATGKLYPVDEAARRVRRALAAAGEGGVPGFVVNARTDVLLAGGTVDQAIERGRAYLGAGATTVFVWGGPKRGGMRREEVTEIVRALDGRVSVKLKLGEQDLTVRELAEIGVARISCGPELWRKAMTAFEQEMNAILGSG
ncbi:hypothetical protein GJ744_009791 [Endocarpon pusillum]|uniref:Carboxyphosphonoenolpyruvate phosphonomutase-like protein n=1 Tax=Endocarpon pusillum TaxID=364733 RepID=A0A8H7E9E1_9EURO|nr:hypothetical protein GJ744_009791 [Endocarpon pusillum]